MSFRGVPVWPVAAPQLPSGSRVSNQNTGNRRFHANFATGNVLEWDSTSVSGTAAPPAAQSSIVRTGSFAMQARLQTSGVNSFRSEVANDTGTVKFIRATDQVIWWGFSFYLQNPFPNTGVFQVIGQWHQDNGTPGSVPVACYVNSTSQAGAPGKFSIGGGGGGVVTYPIWGQPTIDTPLGVWTDVVVRMGLSEIPGQGRVTYWLNRMLMADYVPPLTPTLYTASGVEGDGSGFSYLKHGYYRDSAIPDDASVYIDCVGVGASFDEVDPSRATT